MYELSSFGENLGSLFGQVFGIAFAILIPIAFYLYCRGRVAIKMGDPFALGCIPYANDYFWFQRLWKNPTMFWLYAACCFGSCYIPVVGTLLMVPIQLVMRTKLYWRLGKAFGKTPAFCLGLVVLTPIFLAIIAFDKSTFKAPIYTYDFNGINYGRLNHNAYIDQTNREQRRNFLDALLLMFIPW